MAKLEMWFKSKNGGSFSDGPAGAPPPPPPSAPVPVLVINLDLIYYRIASK